MNQVPPEPAPTPLPLPPAVPRGGLVTTALKPAFDFALVPHVAGIDRLRATLDYTLTVRNTGRAAAYRVAVEAWLFSAGTDTSSVLGDLAALVAAQPLLAPFDLPASGAVDFTFQSSVERDALAILAAGERRMFVPILGARAIYHDRAGVAQVAVAAFMIGVERPGQARLAPLALDRGARGYTGLGARRFTGQAYP